MSNTQTKYHINDADQLVEANKYLLDVREPFEYEMGHIAEADNVSVNEIEERLEELPKDRKIHVYCQRGKRGASAVEILKRNGFDAVNLEEGYSAYTGKYDIADEAGETADAATENDVMGIPSLLIFKNNEKLAHLHSANAKTPEDVKAFLAENLK